MLSSKKPVGTVGVMSGLPCVLEQFTWSMIQMVAYTRDYLCSNDEYVHYARTEHSFHSAARNDLVKGMVGNFLLQLDTDHSFDPDLLCRLANASRAYQAPVICGLYLMKKPPYGPTLWQWDKDMNKSQLADWGEKDVLEIGAAGAGCLFVHRWVFDKIRDELNEEPFSTSEYPGTFGEDFAFFARLRRIDVKPVVVPWIECHHLLVKPLRVDEDYDRSKVDSREVTVQRAVPVEAVA